MFLATSTSYKSIDDLIAATKLHPKFGEFLATKLYNYYISNDTPSPIEVHKLKTGFTKINFEIPLMLKVVLSTEKFWNFNNRLTIVKSPLELLFGTIRTL